MVKAELRVRDLMREDLVVVDRSETLREALEALIAAGVGGAPVRDGDRLVGVLSLRDILTLRVDEPGAPTFRPELDGSAEEPVQQSLDEDALAEEELEDDQIADTWFHDLWEDNGVDALTRMENPESPEWDVLDQHTVDEVMTRRVITVAPDAPVRAAAQKMTDEQVHRLLVVENDAPIGILTTSDVVRAVAQGR